ncbi:hypothetical protein AGABI2DRAFT_144580 [Agaricus bisporus var. bisporus H97]|uniref:hypothetical protein n=1 Tax=Agaricus bisporus var. bisporus (strain H97 / ATCC MYA-4626 / FGSC 10389) TaxID=936046 RepID=UPI00029F768C|nr:hypothetical protein AGABI2DRAFT_144580 [Agaricus bisporus var. bisporus H97]EKV45073.1 hypothetical protein AGABI2DRAFT_144580 [Agaricus bisporus var. bisporus H97]
MSASSGVLPEHALPTLHRNTNTVRVDNVSKSSASEVIALFNALIGQIRSFHEIKDALGTHLEITFFNRDAATKALCMTGYNIGGAFLAVTPIAPHFPNTRPRQPSNDERRNLYVLGLPFALTKNEFAALFSRYGTVSHCVILATVDNSSRRRGFIVMSTHEEARFAMSELTRTQVKGHTIDVSWAVVQRSQGFLDGGDRAMLLESRNAPIQIDENDICPPKGAQSALPGSTDLDLGSYATSADPTPTLLVSKLPSIIFSSTQDLEPLFYPYGPLKKLRVIGAGLNGTLSVLAQYSSSSAAQEAKEALHGQNYINCQVEVQFLRPASSPFDLPHASRVPTPLELNNIFPNFAQANESMAFRPYESSFPSGLFEKRAFQSVQATPGFNPFSDNFGSNVGPVGSRWV